MQDWNDIQLIELSKTVFNHSKPGRLITWAQGMLLEFYFDEKTSPFAFINAGVKEATALHYAAMLCIPQLYIWLIDNKCDVNKMSAYGSPLHCAILTGAGIIHGAFKKYSRLEKRRHNDQQLATMRILFEAGSDPYRLYESTFKPTTTLSLAMYTKRSVRLAVLLLEMGALLDQGQLEELLDLCKSDDDYQQVEQCLTLLLRRLSTNERKSLINGLTLNRALARIASDQKKDLKSSLPDRINIESLSLAEQYELEASMRNAAEFGQPALVMQFLDQYHLAVDVSQEETRKTALHLAAAKDQMVVVKALRDHGASVTTIDSQDRNALHHSAVSGHICLEYFLTQNLDTTQRDKDGMTVWDLAVRHDNIEALKVLYESKRVPETFQLGRTDWRRSLLSYAAEYASVKVLSFLLDMGYSIHVREPGRLTPLHYSAKIGSLEKVQFLVENGADVSVITDEGFCPLHFAVATKREAVEDIVKFLLSKGSDPFLIRDDGIAPIDLLIARDIKSSKIQTVEAALQSILEWGTNQSPVPSDLGRHLIRFCELKLIEPSLWRTTSLRMLLNSGADLMILNESRQTALSILLDSWQRQVGDLSLGKIQDPREINGKATSVIHVALGDVTDRALFTLGAIVGV